MIFTDVNNSEVLTRTQVTVTLILFLIFCVTGTTYAYYYFSSTGGNTITGNMATVNLTLDVEKVFPVANSENTGVLVPHLSNSGSSSTALASALKSGCVDANTNIVCQVYKITIENKGGTATQVVDGKVSFYSDTALTVDVHEDMPSLKWKLVDAVDVNTPTNSVLGTEIDREANANDIEFVSELTMVNDSEFEYYMIIWIDEIEVDQVVDEGKTFYGKIEFNSSNGTVVTATFK